LKGTTTLARLGFATRWTITGAESSPAHCSLRFSPQELS
jgi:hypothetical protein